MNIGEKIKFLRRKTNLTQEELANAAGTTKQTIHKYESGIIANIPASKIKAMADKLGTTPAYLMGWSDETSAPVELTDLSKYGIKPIKTKKFRMLGNIACGQPIFANEDYETFIEASADINADFCLTAKGDSMINARIFDGDIVFIKEQPNVENGEIAAVIVDNEATLKRVQYDRNANVLMLLAENPQYKTLIYCGEELNHIKILGKAVALQTYVR